MKYITFNLLILTLLGCGSSSDIEVEPPSGSSCEYDKSAQTINSVQWDKLLTINATLLSEYQLFENPSNPTDRPRSPGISYHLNSTLFTDHASKYRFLFIPPGCAADFNATDSFDFPIGTTLIKNFSMPSNTSNLGIEHETLLETRLLIKRQTGWIAVPYIWDESLQDGVFRVIGNTQERPVIHNDVALLANYSIPSRGQCLICHSSEAGTVPIGLKARHLNQSIIYNDQIINQLELWKKLKLLSNLPENSSNIEKIPNWKDETQPLHNRAKAYLDINCAHCHSDEGAGALSGLRLEYWRPLGRDHGVCKTSQGWRGGYFDIWPGDSENSGIPKRIRHTEAKDRMPPIGRSLVDEEAAQLISDWIDAMEYEVCSGQ
jgi:uncharacterized repeat protein (TIGR03806 family)